jgi:hypothetical protein
MLTRYVGIASQMYVRSRSPWSTSRDTHALRLDRFNVCFSARMYIGIYTSPAGCRIWFIYQTFIVQFLLLFVEGLLMHRRTFPINPKSPAHPQSLVYALFLRDRLILVILVTFVVGQMASMGVSAGLSYPSNKHTVTCMMVGGNPGGAFFR